MNTAMIVSSFISGLLAAMGCGGGTVLVIYLTNFLSTEQKQAQGINLIFFLFTAFSGLISNIKKGLVDKKNLYKLLKIALPGMFLGFVLLPFVPSSLLRRLFGSALLLLSIKTFFEKDNNLLNKDNDTV